MSEKKKHEEEAGAVAAASDRPETETVMDKKTGETTGTVSTKPADLGDYKGKYTMKGEKEPYGLKEVKDDPHGRTHHLKNVNHYWEGTEEEFKEQFNKE